MNAEVSSAVGFWPNKEEQFIAMLRATVDHGDRSRSPLSYVSTPQMAARL
jgi:hypothetical protein